MRSIPGSKGEHELQERFGTKKRAYAFYDNQMLDHLNPLMSDFIAHQGWSLLRLRIHTGNLTVRSGADCQDSCKYSTIGLCFIQNTEEMGS